MARILILAKEPWLADDNLYAAAAARIDDCIDLTAEQKIEAKENLAHKRTVRNAIGDIIAVEEDKHIWGKKETVPVFYKVDLPGIKKNDVHYLTHSWKDKAVELTDSIELHRKQRYQLNLENLTLAQRSRLETGAVLEMTRAALETATTDHKPIDTIEVTSG